MAQTERCRHDGSRRGRQIYAIADHGLATIVALNAPRDGRANAATLRIDAPLSKTSYKAGEWRLPFLAPGPSRWSRIRTADRTSEYFYYTVGALAGPEPWLRRLAAEASPIRRGWLHALSAVLL
jgi:hypothetical protein